MSVKFSGSRTLEAPPGNRYASSGHARDDDEWWRWCCCCWCLFEWLLLKLVTNPWKRV